MLGDALIVLTVAYVCGVVLLGIELFQPRWPIPGVPAGPLVCFVLGALLAVAAGAEPRYAFATSAVGFLIVTFASLKLTNLRPAGVLTYTGVLLAAVLLVPFQIIFSAETHLSLWTRVPLLAITVASALSLLVPSILTQTLEGWDPILRLRWRRPYEPMLGWTPANDAPMVSIHVPTHAEPPDVVIGTLDALASLDYPNFEVLLIDNNTTDEHLWRPIAEHCARLGARFRFLHVEGITGAKAGALNWARPCTDPKAELIAVVDADYQVDPLWLKHTVGYFEDPVVGFVQCPHAYRDFEHSKFGKMANSIYAQFMYSDMVSLNEHGAGIAQGTMLIIRLAALDAAGGWAEWCLTEDSELSIRIHALGYSSIYVRQPYGWGLIPETFGVFKKQRFRWTFGKGQELTAHRRLFLPGRQRVPSALGPRQRMHHFNSGFSIFMLGIKLVTMPLQFATLLSLLVQGDAVPGNLIPLLPLLAILGTRHVMRWFIYRKVVGTTFREFVGANLMLMSLNYTMYLAGLGLLAGRPAAWIRTNKFRAAPEKYRAFYSTRTEIGLALIYFAFGLAVAVRLPLSELSLFIVVALVWHGLAYATSPLVALIAERDLRKPHTSADKRRWVPLPMLLPTTAKPRSPKKAASYVTPGAIPSQLRRHLVARPGATRPSS